jgi:3-(3-hydroxy-phenyl)propionate hydroxylase
VLHEHELVGATPDAEGVTVTVDSPDGRRDVRCGWLVSCEGVRSNTRRALGLEFSGRVFRDRFLICDVKIDEDRPAERRFWFDPPFHDGQTALMHVQADGVCRIDLQLGWEADAEAEARPESARRRIARMLGHDRFSFEWISAYVFQCRTLERFVHGRVIFAGDSAHQVSPFGARGGNGGVQDADNLAWKLARVVKGTAPAALLESYDSERHGAAIANIGHSSRATDFMTPKSAASRLLRDAVLDLAREAPFARAMVNSGRLSTPAHYDASPLNTADREAWATVAPRPGSAAVDAPVRAGGRPGFLTEQLRGGFTLLADGEASGWGGGVAEPVKMLRLGRDLEDSEGLLRARYDLQPGSVLLFRPDQHLAMRARSFDPAGIEAAVRRCLMLEPEAVAA